MNVVESRRYAMRLLGDGLTAGEVAALLDVSRQTIQKWKKRHAEEGDSGLFDRSHAPLEHPNSVAAEIERLVVRYRRKYKEGPRKLRDYLLQDYPNLPIPAASTMGRILKRRGLTEERRVRRRQQPSGLPSKLSEPAAPNDLWCIDFKGEFEVGGKLCYPFTVTDAFSRFSIAIRSQTGTTRKPVEDCLWRAFQRFGLPKAIRSDNGPPFASYNAPQRLSKLATVWIRLGIDVERIDPGKPSQNGRHERFHKTLKQATARPPAKTFGAQQKRFDRFRKHYNERRPHEALADRPPGEIYAPSSRPRPDRLPPIEHPNAQRILKVCELGRIEFQATRLRITKALAHQTVGLTEIHDDIWEASYGPIAIAHISFRGAKPEVIALR